MSGFLIAAFIVAILAIALIIWPFLRSRASANISSLQLNTAVYRDQFAELERDLNLGLLSQEDYAQAQAELQRRMLEDTAEGSADTGMAAATTAPTTPASRALPVALGAFLLVGAAIGYMAIGNPQALTPPTPAQGGHGIGSAEMERMLTRMKERLQNEPENFQGWAMLARAYKSMNRHTDASLAFARTGPMLNTDANLLVDYADSLAMVKQGFAPEVLALIDRALKLEPTNLQGLWLRGTAFYERERYDKAIDDWELLLKGLTPGSEDARVVTANIAEARLLLGKSGQKAGAN